MDVVAVSQSPMKRVLVCHNAILRFTRPRWGVAIPYEAGLGLSHKGVFTLMDVVAVSQSPMKRVLVCHNAILRFTRPRWGVAIPYEAGLGLSLGQDPSTLNEDARRNPL